MDGAAAVWTLRHRWRAFATYSILLGVLLVAVAIGRTLGADSEPRLPATPAFATIAVWAAWAGVMMLRDPLEIERGSIG
jgi:hypothetical protein